MSEQSDNGIDSEFIGIFAHDLISPLSAIKGCVDLIENLGDLNENQLYYVQRAFAGITRIETIVNNLLDYSRLSEGIPLDYVPFNLKNMIHDVIKFFVAELTTKKVHLQLDIDPNLEDVLGDESLLTHVVQNILGNAIKYNKLDGKIWITVSDERDYVRVDIRDTGIGIAVEDQSKVFDKYYRGKIGDGTIQGNGLGLSIVRMIVEKHEGLIWVDSQLEQGSTFSFTIPRVSRHGMGKKVTDSGIRDALTGFDVLHHESAVEPMDDVDDDTQETTEHGEDSPRDEYEP
jgi:two-component system, OmpR family, phosphate regulon sensor histidine kinase PhoR